MSYILEALRKSERERRRNEKPSIHVIADDVYTHATQSWLKWFVMLVLFGVGVAGVFLWAKTNSTDTSDPMTSHASTDHIVLPSSVMPSNADKPLQVESMEHPSASSTITKPEAKMQSETRDRKIQDISKLPVNIQQALPVIHIAGHIYAKSPAARIVMVNGNIVHEGDIVASGLVLESITPDGVVFRYRGTRFHMGVF